VKLARRALEEMGRDWRGEVPIRLHESGFKQAWGLGSAPPFSREFDNYVGYIECSQPDCYTCGKRRRGERIPTDGDGYYDYDQNHRTRMKRAFQKVRRHAPLEFDVLYLAVMHGLSIEQIAERLTERAVRLGKPERYGVEDVAMLALLGIDKAQRWQ